MLEIYFLPSNETIGKIPEEQLDQFFSWRIINNTENLRPAQNELRSLTSNVQKI